MSAYITITNSYNVRPENDKKVISYSIYGINSDLDTSRGFYKGIFVNLELAKTVYPGWVIRVYIPNNEPAEFINKLIETKEIELFLVDTNLCLRAVRYLPNDDPQVSIWISRDLDSIVTFREKAAVDDWLMNYPDKELHIMSDNVAHIWTIPGGMFGKKNNNNRRLVEFMIWFFNNIKDQNAYAVDCTIAEKFFYTPNNYIQHYSKGKRLNISVPFPPHNMTNCTFVGDYADMIKYFHDLDIQNKYGPFPEQKLPPPTQPQPQLQSPLQLPRRLALSQSNHMPTIITKRVGMKFK
jgi:hypothetical protein